jgi:phosphatidylserine/phosphatidylglycerophosphate/cardiolipin synthase-like enzyme
MRKRKKSGALSVHAIAGTYVVLLGIDLPAADCPGLLGFSVHRADKAGKEAFYMKGMKAFAATDPGFPSPATYPTNEHPIQSFQWADYTAKPGGRYVYTIAALKGTPEQLEVFEEVSVAVDTESPEGDIHDVYFNRGVAGSQAYANRFGNQRPDLVPNRKAFEWLSRGLYEAMEGFMQTDEPGRHGFRIAAYEFHYPRFLAAVKSAADAGSDVRIIYDARTKPSAQPNKPSLTDRNRAAVAAAGLAGLTHERTTGKSFISHNKFIVRLKDGEPDAVWTGGTNFSDGGIYGHSNVAHVVEDPAIAAKFAAYWDLLAGDPSNSVLEPDVATLTPLPSAEPQKGTTVLFSPRSGLAALDWYADRARGAKQGLFMTFAFGMNDTWKDVYRTCRAPLRFALLEKKTRAMEDGPDRQAEEQAIDELRQLNENVFAIGALIETNELDGWVREKLTGLNKNVKYVHNKFMLVDPLSVNPIVIAGWANFSAASTTDNDESMLVISGNKRVADIYLGEFMRLYSHHAFRESLAWRDPNDPPKPLDTGEWWRDYFRNNSRSARRQFFA